MRKGMGFGGWYKERTGREMGGGDSEGKKGKGIRKGRGKGGKRKKDGRKGYEKRDGVWGMV